VVEGCSGVDSLPEHDDVDEQSERAELVLSASLVALAESACVGVDDLACEAVSALVSVVLTQVLGMQYDEEVEVLDGPIGTVRSRVARARHDLVVMMREPDVGSAGAAAH